MRRIGHYAVYVVVRLFVCVLQALPLSTCATIAEAMAWLTHDVLRFRRRVVRDNLARAYPDWSDGRRNRAARAMWAHLYLMVAEIAQLPRKVHDTNWRRHVRLRDLQPLVALLLSERPLIVASAHFGNFELGGYMLGLLGFPTVSVARPLDNPFLNDFINDFRGRTGQSIVPKKGGYELILDVLEHAGTMAFLGDQYAGTKGCWITFFGQPASAHKAVALLSLEHAAPLAVCCARRVDRPLQYELALSGIFDPAREETGGARELTQWYSARLEELIREAPEQYWWLHRRWKDHRPAKRKLARAA
jgi:KDO2-lipid IV(A) lauroyltransferase